MERNEHSNRQYKTTYTSTELCKKEDINRNNIKKVIQAERKKEWKAI